VLSLMLIAHREDHFDPEFFIPGYAYSDELPGLDGLRGALIPVG
jgi:hypothetical protein